VIGRPGDYINGFDLLIFKYESNHKSSNGREGVYRRSKANTKTDSDGSYGTQPISLRRDKKEKTTKTQNSVKHENKR